MNLDIHTDFAGLKHLITKFASRFHDLKKISIKTVLNSALTLLTANVYSSALWSLCSFVNVTLIISELSGAAEYSVLNGSGPRSPRVHAFLAG